MGFRPDKPVYGPSALPDGFDINPDAPAASEGVTTFGAAMRLENPVVSAATSLTLPFHDAPVDPDFRAYEDIEGTYYEQFSDRFVGARNAEHSAMIKAQIDREMDDRRAVEAAGAWGFMAEMAAGLLSPTTLLPGGAVVKGVQGGVRIGKTAMSVAGAAGAAVALDELVLQQTQEMRTGEESAMAIGGSIILGGLLGSAAGSLSRGAYRRAAASAELIPEAVHEFDAGLRSMGAAENARDHAVRREELFQFFNKSQFRLEQSLSRFMPERAASVVASPAALLRPVVRSDPILRAMLSDNIAARRALSDLVETPLQYKVNEQGQTVLDGSRSVESAIKTRRNTELASAYGSLKSAYADYLSDGPAGKVATITAPMRGWSVNPLRQDGKLTSKEFMEAVGEALMRRDQHPIPQVQRAAQMLRKEIYEKAKNDAIEVGIFDEDLQLKYAESYFMRVYNQEKIERHLGDGSADDILPTLEQQFREKRDAAQRRLEVDDTVERAQDELYKSREALRQISRAMKKAEKRARDKRDRAKAAIAREGAVSRSMGSLRSFFDKRAKGLMEGVMEGEEYEAFKKLIKDLRRVDKMEPPSLLDQIRSFGGIKDPRPKNQWRNGDWVSDGTRTEIEDILGERAITVRRNSDGMEIDMMREALAEAGFLPENSTVSDLLDAIRQEAGGQKIYSELDAVEVDQWQALKQVRDDLGEMGIDVSDPIDKIIPKLPGTSRTQKITKAKAGEASRSAKEAGKRAERTKSLNAALDRLDDANARLAELKEDIAPRVREEKKALRQQIKEDVISVNKAKKARGADEYYAKADDLEVREAALDAAKSIIGLKTSAHSFTASTSTPTRARVLDVPDELLMPWLEKDAGIVTGMYFNSIIPQIEMARKFDGDVNMTARLQEIDDEAARAALKATGRQKDRILAEGKARKEDMIGMRDRILGTYKIPENPRNGWVVGTRIARTLAYTGYLGGMVLSAMPDVAGVFARNGAEAAFGSMTLVTDPKRLFRSMKDAREFGAAAEWWLNNRAMSWAELTDEYAANTAFERGLGTVSTAFSHATGMIAWNTFWKQVGGAFAASRMSKAAVNMSKGKATKADMVKLGENGIEPWMATRIAAQIEKHADTNGDLWLPQGRLWDDQEAFDAFQTAMNREMDLQIITIGQDKPLSFSSETGKFFSQFKSFALSSHHRILLSGMQRADASVVAQVTIALMAGMLVSNIKAWQRDDEFKTGAALAEDALDRSGLAGWLMEPYSMAAAFSGGRTSISGEVPSRFETRSMLQGLAGPAFDMGVGVGEGIAALGSGNITENDARKLTRPIPGNNLPYMLGLFQQIQEAIADTF